MDRTDSEALGKLELMLAKELLNIPAGTLISGIRLSKHPTHYGRVAAFNVDGWVLELGARDIPTIRTPFYPEIIPDKHNIAYDAKTAIDLLKTNNYKNCRLGDNDNWDFVDLKKNNPIGVHMGKFFLDTQGSVENIKDKRVPGTYTLVFSKLLMCDGRIGFLVFSTKDINKESLHLL